MTIDFQKPTERMRQVVEVYRATGSVAETAERIGITPDGVRYQIREYERRIGDRVTTPRQVGGVTAAMQKAVDAYRAAGSFAAAAQTLGISAAGVQGHVHRYEARTGERITRPRDGKPASPERRKTKRLSEHQIDRLVRQIEWCEANNPTASFLGEYEDLAGWGGDSPGKWRASRRRRR
jgi:hypothetical protein